MSSDSHATTTVSARALASRQNGARSRGPRTAAGKARSSRNALKHGLSARKLLVLPEEDVAAFKALETALQGELAPVGALQAVLAERVVSAAWRLLRADRLEAEVLEFRRAPQGGLGLALIRDGNGTRSFDTVLRYRNAAMAELLRAEKTLRALQAEARAHATPHDAPARRRRARPRIARPNEPEQRRQVNGSTENRVLDRRPATQDRGHPIAPKTDSPKPATHLRPPHESPGMDRPDAAPRTLAASLPGTKPTREIASNQRLDLRTSRRSAA